MVDRCVVISLGRRADRLSLFCELANRHEWPFPDPEIFAAVDGGSGVVPVPHYWQSGGGAYGCQQSHVQVLQRALMDDVRSIAVFEDDAIMQRSFADDVRRFLHAIPAEWEAAMLGGQHIARAIPVSAGVVRCANTQRTHAYVLRGEAIKDVCQLFESSRHHIDWDLGPFLGGRGKTYAPDPFLVGQGRSVSDINGKTNSETRWSQPQGDLPVVWLRAPRAVAEGLRAYGFHYGHYRDRDGNDRGLNEIFQAPGVCGDGLRRWIGVVQWECYAAPEANAICTIWHPHATPVCEAEVSAATRHIVIEATSVDDAVAQAIAAMGEQAVFRRIRPI